MQAFETPRLRMRALQPSDEDLYVAFYTDPEIMRCIGAPLDQAQTRRAFGRLLQAGSGARSAFVFAMHARESGAVVGLCGMSRIVPARMRAEVGVMLKSQARGMGFATEGLTGTLDAVFGAYASVQRIVARCSSFNPSAERMVAGIGFQLEDPLAAAEGELAMRSWYVQRSSWNRAQTPCQQGDNSCRK